MYDYLFNALLALSTGTKIARRDGRDLAAAGYASEALDGTFAITPDGDAALTAELGSRKAPSYGPMAVAEHFARARRLVREARTVRGSESYYYLLDAALVHRIDAKRLRALAVQPPTTR